MKICSHRLKNEAAFCEGLDIQSFCHFSSSPTVAICGEMAFCVWFVQPSLTEHAGFDGVKFDVYRFWYTMARLSVIEVKYQIL